jgi:hypothetical protein
MQLGKCTISYPSKIVQRADGCAQGVPPVESFEPYGTVAFEYSMDPEEHAYGKAPFTSDGIHAIAHVRRMRGGAQAQLMRCSDEHYYVVKFMNNLQGAKILFNELLGARLAACLGLPVAASEIVFVDQELIDLYPQMTIEQSCGRSPCQGGWSFGSRLPVDPRDGHVYDSLPFYRVKNHKDFLGMLVFDKWTCNTDGRQVVFYRQDPCDLHSAVMIDQGFCFNAAEWNFPDSPLRGRYSLPEVYDNVTGMDSFEPWLTRLECQIDGDSLAKAAEGIPQDWHDTGGSAVVKLLDQLNRRRNRVRDLLWSARKSSDMFPHWGAN